MTVIYYMSIDRADKPWIGDRRLTEGPPLAALLLASPRTSQSHWPPDPAVLVT
jgi:hypothetical protein